MKTAFEEYQHFWGEDELAAIKPLLNSVRVLRAPLKQVLPAALDIKKTLVVVQDLDLDSIMRILSRGFEHVLQEQRADFKSELLISCTMMLRPETFRLKPIQLFLDPSQKFSDVRDKVLSIEFSSSANKQLLMDWMIEHLSKDPRAAVFKDVALQIADEMIMNAIFDAPIDMAGYRFLKDRPRTMDSKYPSNMPPARFFSFLDKTRLVIGCQDPYGSIRRQTLLALLSQSYSDSGQARSVESAHMGIRFMIDNSSGFYVHCDTSRRTLFACVLLLEGLRPNFAAKKHFHLCVP